MADVANLAGYTEGLRHGWEDAVRQPHDDEAPLREEIIRLRKRIKNLDREIYVLRYVVMLLWKGTGYRQMWRINGEGKHRHLNDGRGTSYGPVEDSRTGKVLITSAQLCKVVDRALGTNNA